MAKKQESRTTTIKSFCPLRIGMKIDGNGWKIPHCFSTSTFEYENESGKAGYENEHELWNLENFKNELIREKLCRTTDP